MWSDQQPTEPGWYWWKPLKASVVAEPMRIPRYRTMPAPWGKDKPFVPTTGYWWPVRIEEPETTGESR